MDPESAAQVLELFIQDAEEILADDGHFGTGAGTDNQIALHATLEALQAQLQVARDSYIAHGLVERDSETDPDTGDDHFTELLIRARRLVRRNKHNASDRPVTPNAFTRAFPTSTRTSNAGPSRSSHGRSSNSSLQAAASPPSPSSLSESFVDIARLFSSTENPVENNAQVSQVECVACEDTFSESGVVDLACSAQSHKACKQCLQDMFTMAIQDEASFPPRCCQEVLLEHVWHALDPDLVRTYQEKEVEYRTMNRIYCIECYGFISPENIKEGIASCRKCESKTCGICGERAHSGDCPKDPNIEVTLHLAKKEGWKRCESCHRVIELVYGCNHMVYAIQHFPQLFSFTNSSLSRCHCGREFCFLCGKKWKTCRCERFTEERLLRPENR